ncbi:NirD/YgiW/YdeI family stress tolerance protein [Acinetobacter sp. ANC 4779]|uniref:NirD/YgiW/YdeI family stress tolerance protein n=1 Tax=Acinetobacter sp. ANC 4779 TaxID=2529848 RepID=UPI00103B9290|nr:NirD/YgiW/YdeI family stress tolerance protein [Acinetobacter sp. ANC 4779]TCB47644.1 NirD/YgiW/YdeI family stress tolerance protein [Acinetobacter sp. ANC 4779]
MNKILLTIITGLCLLGSSLVFAKSEVALVKEASKNVVTVAKAKTLTDETGVTLKGTIVQHISGDDFEFKDSTGSIVIDVDDDLWKPMQLKAGDKVSIIGEIDTHRIKPTDIDVIQIERMK